MVYYFSKQQKISLWIYQPFNGYVSALSSHVHQIIISQHKWIMFLDDIVELFLTEWWVFEKKRNYNE